MFKDLVDFFKNPEYKPFVDIDLNQKFSILFWLLLLSVMISILLGMTIGVLQTYTDLDLGQHAMDLLFEEYQVGFIFLAVVLAAPVLEELLFRGPMFLFRKSSYFGFIFYALTLLFGFYHITNFKITNTILLLSPLLVAPQLFIGMLLGYIRVRLGLLWAITLHALYNLVIIGPLILLKLLNIPIG